ncbi:MAG TPA: D-amino acid aminotransferase [Sulfurospirillum sp. UBA11407]|jgi:D-alanine transaminase|nr:MAG TPA: D-amino acid aminotransferase [Sulfurospirillum sp. UBA11407]DAB34986.1 MAG TPA: D-amino acid aminotransferase [Sulfurospirillum sp. UBA12182]
MSEIIYLNGSFLNQKDAKISVFDRGFLFGDGVYEVVPVIDGVIIEIEPFFERFERSLHEIGLFLPLSKDKFLQMLQSLVLKNNLKEGGIYTQITRGVAPREFAFPKDTMPTSMAFCFEKEIIDNPKAKSGVSVVSVEDIRWKRRDIKSISLLGQCLAKEQSVQEGAYEGWMVEDGLVTEGTASTAYIVKNGVIITRELSHSVLPGIRRKILLQIAQEHGVKVELRPFSLIEAYSADEAFLSSATNFILPIVQVDGNKIGDGKPGVICNKLRELYIQHALDEVKK